jgi:hypothetical protein
VRQIDEPDPRQRLLIHLCRAYCAVVPPSITRPADEPAATYERASDERGRLGISGATNRLGLGDKIRLVPRHCDPTVNLYDWYISIRGKPGRTTLAHHRAGGDFLISCLRDGIFRKLLLWRPPHISPR